MHADRQHGTHKAAKEARYPHSHLARTTRKLDPTLARTGASSSRDGSTTPATKNKGRASASDADHPHRKRLRAAAKYATNGTRRRPSDRAARGDARLAVLPTPSLPFLRAMVDLQVLQITNDELAASADDSDDEDEMDQQLMDMDDVEIAGSV
ncbi:hypothetical protein CspHIS471_0500080 [Cutaneotrichosporon sp. HIS471]|nr:hypothetical protein CspHIS471_0500080 [Cutaneotrichosporon sp. HIS471]